MALKAPSRASWLTAPCGQGIDRVKTLNSQFKNGKGNYYLSWLNASLKVDRCGREDRRDVICADLLPIILRRCLTEYGKA